MIGNLSDAWVLAPSHVKQKQTQQNYKKTEE